MARKRVSFRRIENDSARKASLKKKSANLIKKLSELCVLCDVVACVVISGPDIDNDPIIWPPRTETEEILTRFESIPDIDKYQKSTNHESFMKENINKLEEQLAKCLKQIERIETNEMMYQIFTIGKRFIDFPIDKLIALRDDMEEQLKELDKKIAYLERSAGTSGSQQEQGTSQRAGYVPGDEALGEDDGEKYENITNPIDYAGIEKDASHWNQASQYRGIVPSEGGNTANASASHVETIVGHDQASTVHVGGTATLSFHPESILGGNDSNMMTTLVWGAGEGIEDASGFNALASYGSGQETIRGNINTSQSDDTFPFLKGWGLAGGYVTGGLHDVVLGQRRVVSGSTSGTCEASALPRAPRNRSGDGGVDGNETEGGTNEAGGCGSNAGAMN